MSGRSKDGTTSSAIARVVVDGATQLGIAPAEYAGLRGLDPEYLYDDLYRTPTLSSVRVWELLVADTRWPEVAALLVRRCEPGTLGLWDYLIASAATLLEGVTEAMSLLGVIADTSTETVEVLQTGRQVTIGYLSHTDSSYDAASALHAYGLGLLHRRICEAARLRVAPVRVSLTATARDRGPLVDLFGTRSIDFDAPTSSITFLAADLHRPSACAQPGLSALLRRQVEQNLAATVPLHSWLDTFHASVRALCVRDDVTLAAVAQRMALSPRTLQRRLDECGTTWTDQLESVRRQQVTGLLRDTDLSVAAIAARTGYADARALRRAVQRWCGSTPGALRQSLRGGSAAELAPTPP